MALGVPTAAKGSELNGSELPNGSTGERERERERERESQLYSLLYIS